jgi:hypothetical protein
MAAFQSFLPQTAFWMRLSQKRMRHLRYAQVTLDTLIVAKARRLNFAHFYDVNSLHAIPDRMQIKNTFNG